MTARNKMRAAGHVPATIRCGPRNGLRRAAAALAAGLALSACAAAPPPPAPEAARFILPVPPPPAASLRAAAPAEVAGIARAAERFARAAARAEGLRADRREAAALPLLFGAPEGRAFRAAAGPRALALGDPARSCPARAAGTGPDTPAAARAALSACFDQLAAAGAADPGCGCRVIAAGSSLLAPAADFAWAPGVSARLVSADLDLDLDLAAREEAGPSGVRRLRLGPLPPGRAAVVEIPPDAPPRLSLNGETWQGRREAEGLTRGRFRERFRFQRPDGARLALAVGWPPLAFALARPDRTPWPGD